jgi:hypothetical protein
MEKNEEAMNFWEITIERESDNVWGWKEGGLDGVWGGWKEGEL